MLAEGTSNLLIYAPTIIVGVFIFFDLDIHCSTTQRKANAFLLFLWFYFLTPKICIPRARAKLYEERGLLNASNVCAAT